MNAYYSIDGQETNIVDIEHYDVDLIFNKANSMNKYRKFHDEINSVNNDKIINRRKKDSRYSFKNRRTINKDWKDFNNNQM